MMTLTKKIIKLALTTIWTEFPQYNNVAYVFL